MEYKFIKKFQEGGAMPPQGAPQGAEQGAPEEQGAGAEQDPMAMLLQAAAQALQNQDCNMAVQVCQVLVQMAQQGQGGAPEEAGQPVYRKGGRLVRRIKK